MANKIVNLFLSGDEVNLKPRFFSAGEYGLNWKPEHQYTIDGIDNTNEVKILNNTTGDSYWIDKDYIVLSNTDKIQEFTLYIVEPEHDKHKKDYQFEELEECAIEALSGDVEDLLRQLTVGLNYETISDQNWFFVCDDENILF